MLAGLSQNMLFPLLMLIQIWCFIITVTSKIQDLGVRLKYEVQAGYVLITGQYKTRTLLSILEKDEWHL